MAKTKLYVTDNDVFKFISKDLSWKKLYHKNYPKWFKRIYWAQLVPCIVMTVCSFWSMYDDDNIWSALIGIGSGLLLVVFSPFINKKKIEIENNILNTKLSSGEYSNSEEFRINKIADFLKEKDCYNINAINNLKETFAYKIEESKIRFTITNTIAWAILIVIAAALYGKYLDLKMHCLDDLLTHALVVLVPTIIIILILGLLYINKKAINEIVNRKSYKYREATSLLNTLLLNQKRLQRSPLRSTKKHKQVKNSL